jgi:hypothetical protein
MSIDRSVPGSSCQILAVSKRNVLAVRALVTLSETKVDDVNGILSLIVTSNQKVIGLDISMDYAFFMHYFDSLDHLYRNVEHRFQIEFSATLLEQVLKTFT